MTCGSPGLCDIGSGIPDDGTAIVSSGSTYGEFRNGIAIPATAGVVFPQRGSRCALPGGYSGPDLSPISGKELFPELECIVSQRIGLFQFDQQIPGGSWFDKRQTLGEGEQRIIR